MCDRHRIEFRCKHIDERISFHKGGDFLTSINDFLKKDPRDCPRCVERAASLRTGTGVNNITAGVSGMELSTPPLPRPERKSALYAQVVKLVIAAREAKQRAALAAAPAAAPAAATKQPAQAAAPPASRVPAAARGGGAPAGTSGAKGSGGRAAGGAPPAVGRAPAVRGGQVGNKVQGRVVVPCSSGA
ncbi:hypothetical protein B0I37DRAFT_363516 [Chaetomium sp. MPI-CAGE-AT-0009]|nr:hypothetical protein B0I37DRAFT_363516 [Chaetomium sp. MPI-CAGE-AT-0009]